MAVRWATAQDLIQRGPAVVRELVPEDGSLYASDVLDPSLVAGTTVPEPGGLGYRELRSVVRGRRQATVGTCVLNSRSTALSPRIFSLATSLRPGSSRIVSQIGALSHPG